MTRFVTEAAPDLLAAVVRTEYLPAFDADPKTDAGKRTVTIPPHVLPVLAEHMITLSGSKSRLHL